MNKQNVIHKHSHKHTNKMKTDLTLKRNTFLARHGGILWEAKAGTPQIQAEPGQPPKTLFQNKKLQKGCRKSLVQSSVSETKNKTTKEIPTHATKWMKHEDMLSEINHS